MYGGKRLNMLVYLRVIMRHELDAEYENIEKNIK
jgi:hypothetical protein